MGLRAPRGSRRTGAPRRADSRRHGVDPAPDGTTALRLAAARQPDVVPLDLGLPDMDGTEVIKALRGWSRVPILVLSARRASEEKVAALDAGADDHITKPFSMDELLARLRAAVRRTEDAPLAPETVLVTTDDFTRPARQEGHPRGPRRPAHPDRMASAGDPGHQPRPAHHAEAAAPGGLGSLAEQLCAFHRSARGAGRCLLLVHT